MPVVPLSQKFHKIAYLDGVRGVAALMVVFYHLCGLLMPYLTRGHSQNPTLAQQLIFNSGLTFIYNGNFAVCIFFALSGYVLTIGFWRTGSANDLVRKAFGRYVRLAPPVLVSSLICAVLIAGGYYAVDAVHDIVGAGDVAFHLNQAKLDFAPLRFLRSVLFDTFVLNKGEPAYNPVLWTMQIEFRGSFIAMAAAYFTAMIVRMGSRRLRAEHELQGNPQRHEGAGHQAAEWDGTRNWAAFLLLNLLGLAIVLALKVRGMYHWEFLMGVALASLKGPDFGGRIWKIVTLVVALYLGGDNGSVLYHWLDPILNPICPGNARQVAHILGAALFLAVLLNSGILKRFFSARPARFLGRISFSLYLLHLAIVFTIGCGIFVRFANTVPQGELIAFVFVLTISLSILVAYLFCLLVDEPSTRWSRSFGHWAAQALEGLLGNPVRQGNSVDCS